jgi:uncharacterized membrane protein
MAKSREEVEAMLAIEEAIAAGAGAGVSNASEMNRDTTGQQIQVLQRIAEQIRNGTLPPGSLTGVPSDNINADVAEFERMIMGLPPEVISAVLGTGGAVSDRDIQMMQMGSAPPSGFPPAPSRLPVPPAGGIQPQNFGALQNMGASPGTGGATTGRPVQNMGASPGTGGATIGNTGMPPTAAEAALFEEFAAGVRARGSQRR